LSLPPANGLLSFHSDFHPIVDSLDQILFGSEVPLGGLDGGMAEQQLNLLEFPTRFAAELRAGAPQIMRCEMRMTDGGAGAPHQG